MRPAGAGTRPLPMRAPGLRRCGHPASADASAQPPTDGAAAHDRAPDDCQSCSSVDLLPWSDDPTEKGPRMALAALLLVRPPPVGIRADASGARRRRRDGRWTAADVPVACDRPISAARQNGPHGDTRTTRRPGHRERQEGTEGLRGGVSGRASTDRPEPGDGRDTMRPVASIDRSTRARRSPQLVDHPGGDAGSRRRSRLVGQDLPRAEPGA